MRPRSGSSNAAGGGTPKSRARTLYEGDGCRGLGDRENERASPIAHHRERSEHSLRPQGAITTIAANTHPSSISTPCFFAACLMRFLIVFTSSASYLAALSL